jgi:drug/metabolite transporter (DMT)-like permease
MVKNDITKGLIAISMAAFLFGAAGALAKILFKADISPIDLTAIRAIVACALFALFLMITSRQALRLTRDAMPLLLASGIAFTAVNISFYLAIRKINVAAAITLEYTAPLFVLILSVLLHKRRLSWRDVSTVGVAIIGCFLLTGTSTSVFSLSSGVLWGLFCGFSFGVANMIGNACSARGITPACVTFYSFLVSALIWMPALPFLSVWQIQTDLETLSLIGFITVVATIIPYWLLMYGLRHVDALPATIVGMLDPVAAGLLAFILIGETLTGGHITGIALILLAISFLTRSQGQEP